MDKMSKDVLSIITNLLDNTSKIALKLTCKYLYWKLFSIKPEIEYSTIVLYRISKADPHKEFSFEIKRVKSKDQEKIITLWGQKIIDEFNDNLLDECCLDKYKPFCYKCRMYDICDHLSDDHEYHKCKQHPNQKNLYISDETYNKISKCGCLDLEFPYPPWYWRSIIYTHESEGYNCSKMFFVLGDYNTTYDYSFRFFVYEGEKEFDHTHFCVVDH